ncbi:protein of unknown function [Actinopolyspora xinjiangensis]|uniref:DUF397 domain-containing protein n=1 Tax=Actinopolyspora xinjiangensis TaxID=405564 RepID=A0A1H0W4E6_9ACTN|nr:DUF397 domain-containing protein [Actinopolyspora xinjiangensis]SDP85186.1 protein of unknown function [Actinopolyspora xinjiangensis]
MSELFSWRSSTRTQGQGQCVEVGFASTVVRVRDSKNRLAGQLSVGVRQWGLFLNMLKGDSSRRCEDTP